MYDCLPMYHTVGGVIAPARPDGRRLGVHPREILGAPVLGRRRRQRVHAVPVRRRALPLPGQRAAVHPKEGQHRIRLACGNGLRPDIWQAFKTRFRIPIIREFYAATEGNAIMFNLDGKPGAIGRCPAWARFIFPMAVVRFDIESETPVRGADGFCERCRPARSAKVIAHRLRSAQARAALRRLCR
jgi:fatty-acyl-CoA synthase